MYITICETDDQSKFDYEAGHSKPVHRDNSEGWDGEGGGRGGSRQGDTCISLAESCKCMAKNHHNIVK